MKKLGVRLAELTTPGAEFEMADGKILTMVQWQRTWLGGAQSEMRLVVDLRDGPRVQLERDLRTAEQTRDAAQLRYDEAQAARDSARMARMDAVVRVDNLQQELARLDSV